METTASKFILPSPNFNKNSQEPSKSNLHYLTPCGMTLLPRSKQPPPMYGARGSTVPAKYLQQQQHNGPVNLPAPVYDPPRQPEYCYNCGLELATERDMKMHLEQHEPCPVNNCDFAALSNILERHIEANHITGSYKTVKRVWTQEEIASWRAERRKRYPTAANVEMVRLAKEQRQKRGERLEASRARFGKREDRRRTQPFNKNSERPVSKKHKKVKMNKRPVKHLKKELVEQPSTSLDTLTMSSTGVPMFRGTSEMADYKHFKRKSSLQANALTALGMYGSDSEDSTEESSEEMTTNSVISKPSISANEIMVSEEMLEIENSEKISGDQLKGNDSLNAHTNDASPLNATTDDDVKPIADTGSSDAAPNEGESFNQHSIEVSPLREISVDDVKAITEEASSDDAPDEAPIERMTEESITPKVKHNVSVNDKVEPIVKLINKRTAPKKRVYGLNYTRARKLINQNTMLEKLLETDIRHERNLLLQCVRYVCEQNFFSIGDSNAKETSNETAENT